MRKPSVLVVFLTVFIDLIGFGLVLPLLPIYSQEFGASGFMIGAIMASFSAMQFLFAPAWGRLSDRIGRRPVLLVSTAGAAVSYAIFAIGSGFTGQTALWIILGSRVLAGICGANITVAQAYIADVTPPESRSKKMGLIGMAFGLGFICGPMIGLVSPDSWGVPGPGWIAAGLCAANFFLAVTILPESWKPNSEHAAQRPRLEQWTHTFRQPKIGLIIAVFFLATFCFTCFETTLGLLVSQQFGLDLVKNKGTIYFLFAYAGVVGAVVQGGAIGRLVKKMGEPKLISVSLILFAIGMAPFPFIHGTEPLSWAGLAHPGGLAWLVLFFFLALLSIGSALTRPPIFGLISILTPAHEQGATIGVAQSAGSLARIVGPVFASTLFTHHPALPYLVCSGISLIAGFMAWQSLCKVEPEGTVAEPFNG
jgi:DHA1 family tetracycline resistance protein-like MFS transporter